MEEKLTCPKCYSNDITTYPKGFSGSKAAISAILAETVGGLYGLHGISDIIVNCLTCGNSWNANQLFEKDKSRKIWDRKINVQKSNDDRYIWRQSFYKAYNKKDFIAAEKIYLSREKYEPGIPDIHSAYKLQKQLDHAHTVVVLGTFAFLILCLFGITECVA